MRALELVVISGPAVGARIDPGDELVLGRSVSGPGALGADPQLSRRHARIRLGAVGHILEDLGSTNGTELNGRRITGPVVLRPGDRVSAGSTVLEVRALGAASGETATASERAIGATPAIPVAAAAPPTPAAPAAAIPAAVAIPAAAVTPAAVYTTPFAPPPVRRRSASRLPGLVAALIIVCVAIASSAATWALRGSPSSLGGVVGVDGTAYVESNSHLAGQNSVIALRHHAGSFRPLRATEYPTGGTGSFDLLDRGVLDADQQLTLNSAHTLLFAVNQGSDSIAVFKVAADGTLRAVAGSPFPSGGAAPASLGLSGDILVVANKAQDGVRDLTASAPNYTTLRVASDGTLSPTGHTVVGQPKASPTQTYVDPAGRFVYSTEEAGTVRAFTIGSDGALTEAGGSPYALPDTLFPSGRPSPVWPAGLALSLDSGLLYTGVPNANLILSLRVDASGHLAPGGTAVDPDAVLPCWSVVSGDGKRLYFADAGSDSISVFDLSADPTRPSLLQHLKMSGGGNPWNLRLDPSGNLLYVITPRQVAALVPLGSGQLLHSLRVAADGTLTELADSPVNLPVASTTNPFGLAISPDR